MGRKELLLVASAYLQYFNLHFLLGVLNQVVEKCKAGESTLGLCEFGDNLLNEETGKVYKKEKGLKKGTV